VRIIAGAYKGRILKSVQDPRLRPATDRVKEAIFNILQNRLDLRGARVLDLFAGSGSLGFEAISRGASLAVFVDDWQGAVKTIEANARLLHCEDRSTVIKADVHKFLSRAKDEFDLVFVDPPYDLEASEILPLRIFQRGLVSRNGILIMEHRAKLRIETTEGIECLLTRTFGNTAVSMLRRTMD